LALINTARQSNQLNQEVDINTKSSSTNVTASAIAQAQDNNLLLNALKTPILNISRKNRKQFTEIMQTWNDVLTPTDNTRLLEQ